MCFTCTVNKLKRINSHLNSPFNSDSLMRNSNLYTTYSTCYMGCAIRVLISDPKFNALKYLIGLSSRIFAPVYELETPQDSNSIFIQKKKTVHLDGLCLPGVWTEMNGEESRLYYYKNVEPSINIQGISIPVVLPEHLFVIKPRMSNNLAAHFNPILRLILQHLLKRISQHLNLIITQPCSKPFCQCHRAIIEYP